MCLRQIPPLPGRSHVFRIFRIFSPDRTRVEHTGTIVMRVNSSQGVAESDHITASGGVLSPGFGRLRYFLPGLRSGWLAAVLIWSALFIITPFTVGPWRDISFLSLFLFLFSALYLRLLLPLRLTFQEFIHLSFFLHCSISHPKNHLLYSIPSHTPQDGSHRKGTPYEAC